MSSLNIKKIGLKSFAFLCISLFTTIHTSTATAEEMKYLCWQTSANPEGLSENDIELLNKNRFIITNQTYKQVFTPYIEGNTSLFITTDSLLNAYHVLYEESIFRLESTNANKLHKLLQPIIKRLAIADKELNGRPKLVAEAKKRATIVIGTALQLLDEDFHIDNKQIDTIIKQEVKKIVEAKTKGKPSWLGEPDRGFLGLDYSRYKPQGFYIRSEKLKRYFRAVAWLQSIPFRVDRDDELLAVLMLGSCVPHSTFANSIDETTEYKNFFRAYKTFIGASDNWDLITAAEQVRSGFQLDLRENDLTEIREKLNKRATNYGKNSQLNDQLRFAPTDPSAVAEANFRIISAYRIPDAILFQRTTDLRQFDRSLPDGLEVCAALGSRFARDNLKYKDKEKLLRVIDETKTLFSGYSLYFAYLECLAALLDEPEKDAPVFMRKKAWQVKSCNTALAGWAQLRHTWALQAKQTQRYTGMAFPPRGFVEPVPEFYSRMTLLAESTYSVLERSHAFDMDYDSITSMLTNFASLLEGAGTWKNLHMEIDKMNQEKLKEIEAGFMIARYMTDYVDKNPPRQVAQRIYEIVKDLQKGKLPQDKRLVYVLKGLQRDIRPLWQEFEQVCRRLELLAHKQLREVNWNQSDERFIKNYGTTIARIMLYGGNAYLSPYDDAPRVVGVYSNPLIPKGYLHVGIGRPRTIYVLYPWQGVDILCEGAVLPYYEFAHVTRLIDSEWRQLLDSAKPPCVPEWIRPIVWEKGIGKAKLKSR